MIVKNYGVSLGNNLPNILIVSGIFLVYLIFLAIKERKMSLWMAVVGGGLNFGERIVRGYVIDYWKIPGISLYNNVNDWLIFVGLGLYLWQKLKSK